MALTAADFTTSPPGQPAPSALELERMGLIGAGERPEDRLASMNAICPLVGVPLGGWTGGQSRLIEVGDLRLVWLLRRLAHKRAAALAAQSLGYAARFVSADLMLTLVTAARENARSIEAVSMQPIDSWREGGLDFLWKEKDKLGLPASITRKWREVRSFPSPETGRPVFPASIPARDQVLVYAAQLNASVVNYFNNHIQDLTRADPKVRPGFWAGGRIASLVWKAYAFLAPGGPSFDPTRSFSEQAGQRFGCRTALTYLATTSSGSRQLDRILTDAELNRLEWVRIAKARCAEALFLERLWRMTRELLPI